jgi:hypothetical protein
MSTAPRTATKPKAARMVHVELDDGLVQLLMPYEHGAKLLDLLGKAKVCRYYGGSEGVLVGAEVDVSLSVIRTGVKITMAPLDERGRIKLG